MTKNRPKDLILFLVGFIALAFSVSKDVMAQVTPEQIELEIKNSAEICAAINRAQEIRNLDRPILNNPTLSGDLLDERQSALHICAAIVRASKILRAIESSD